MTNEPSPLPATSRWSGRLLFVSLAAASWITFILAVIVDVSLAAAMAALGGPAGTPYLLLTFNLVLIASALVGVLSGIVALFGLAKHGRIGIRAPAIIGLALWLLTGATAAAIGVIGYVRAHEREIAARTPVHLAPALHAPGAEVLRDAELAFSVDLPEDYRPFAKGTIPPGYRYAYIKAGVHEPNRVFAIKPLGSEIPKNQRQRAADLHARGSSLTTFNWRGLPVDAIRILEKSATGAYVTFNIRIPIKKRALVLSFGGPALAEPEIQALAGNLLATLDAETNW
jgi:hypothetical protein